ncbi:MAG: DUF1552 domain-containing protein, partial [Verrucomicrobiota bacterium]
IAKLKEMVEEADRAVAEPKAKWVVDGVGKNYRFNETHQPYAHLKEHFHLFSQFAHESGTSGGDGGGDHARANASFLTGVRPYKTAGADIRLGISVDQMIANAIGDQTRFRSLELSCDGVRKAGVCDSGYSCAYQFNLSWRNESSPMTPEANPRLVFERLFGAGSREERTQGFAARNESQRSILDFVLEDAQSLERKLGRNDQLKLDEYLTGVREIEQRIEKSERFGLPELPDGVSAPAGIPDVYQDHVRLMMDMLILAFETDSTRVATFLLAHDGSNRSFREIGVPGGHHSISHHQKNPDKLSDLAKIDKYYSSQFAYFLEQMEKKKDVDGSSLLHNSQILWGSGLADPDRHRHEELPIILAGHGGGSLQTGHHTDLGSKTPLCNLFLSMLDQVGVKEDRFGDSTGKVGITV